ncbi:MAG: DNA polymerase III subunit delta [Acidimicrobiales bacterium]|nr:DNA polymerase III subunit delta [Acidimicrobiales bacterium]
MSKFDNVYLIRGDEPSIVSRELEKLITSLLENEDKSLVVEELLEDDYQTDSEIYSVESLVSAIQTVPFLTRKRIVIGRDFARFSKKEDLEPLFAYMKDPIETNYLILVWEKGAKLQRANQIPKSLIEAVNGCGEVIDIRVGRKVNGWIREQVGESSIMLDEASITLLEKSVGEEIARIPAILATLESVFGSGSALQSSDIEPYIGQAGNVVPWELTDRITSGNAASALGILTRMQGNGAQHQMQILGFLSNHYFRILQLSGRSGVTSEEAANLLGDKSAYRAKKTLSEANRLGPEKSKRAIQLLAEADVNLRGGTGVPAETVMEVLVARLSSLYKR